MFLGRRDRQVKVRGHRIDLEEIERQLLNFPGIREAHVALEGKGPKAGLLAWVTGQDLKGAGFALYALRRMAADRFGRAALPRIMAILELPRKLSGKIDRAALPMPASDGHLVEDDEADILGPVPDTALVIAVGHAMGDVLGRET
jgi:acyl-coenzyme A synthetase/AMP-(fatty) acid ligase